RRRGVLHDARSFQLARRVRSAGASDRSMHRVGRKFAGDEGISRGPVHAYRARHQGHRPLGPASPEGLYRYGCARIRRHEDGRFTGARRSRRGGIRQSAEWTTRWGTGSRTMKAEFSVKDKVAIITGGSKGIGRAIALTLAEYGA